MSKISEAAVASVLLLLLGTGTMGAWSALGPQIESTSDTTRENPADQVPLDLPPLVLAVPVLDPGLPKNPEVWEKRGIWPELRRAESVRSAHLIADAIRSRKLFDSVVVAPDTTTSADLYLLGQITVSNGEDLRIKLEMLDATGKAWIPKKLFKQRVPEGWHENNAHRNVDPFADLYEKIATAVEKRLIREAKRHADIVKRNQSRIAKGQSPKLSDVERVTLTKDLVLARYFAPDVYGDTLKESNGRLRLRYLPAMDTEEWTRIQLVQARDRDFGQKLSQGYAHFAQQMQGSYALWQRDSFPFAREQRLLGERAAAQAVIGVLAAAATVAAAADGDVGTLPTAAAGVASAALLYSSFRTNEKRKAEVAELNELGRSLQSELAPASVELRERTVTLKGTATEQFTQWRGLLRELYANDSEDLAAVTVVGAGR
ncbi:MAG: hypothetical protein OXJ53_19825 [Gammaproteobacteria bacterium]|nr:hypothetical protein [Gammaproteobacteria bacterium]MDE0271881.1 hypothetical protein [Gammaproteobacteria bacterium]